MCDLIDKIFIKDNFKVKKVFNVIEVKEFIEEFILDIILFDIILLDNFGFEFCKEVKFNVCIVDIFIIFIILKNIDIDIVKGFGVGVIDYMVKFFSMIELKVCVIVYFEVKKF